MGQHQGLSLRVRAARWWVAFAALALVATPMQAEEWIFFQSDRGTTPDGLHGTIWQVRPDGTGLEQLTFDTGVIDTRPVLGPDGRTLVFARTPSINGGTCLDLWSLDLVTRVEARITDLVALGRNAYNATLSPEIQADGTMTLAFNSRSGPTNCTGPIQGGAEQIWTVSFRPPHAGGPATGTATQLTASGPSKAWPDWSPLGDRVLFSTQIGSGCGQFTTTQVHLTTLVESAFVPHVSAYSPRYSRDGSQIAWIDACGAQIGIADVGDAASVRALTPSGYGQPAWSPSSEKIVGTFRQFVPQLRDTLSIIDVATGVATPIPIPPPPRLDSAPWWGDTAGACEWSVDVKPNDRRNRVNLKSRGVIPVAVLSTAECNALTIDVSTLVFGPRGAKVAHRFGHQGDVNGDGLADLVVHFQTQDVGLACGDHMVTLVGRTFDGRVIEGVDSISPVGCR